MDLELVPQTILYIIIILSFAKLFGELAERVGQPPVLGELVAGVVLGSSVLGWVHPNEALMVLAELGVILLLFEIGLESDLEEFLRVGPSAILVAIVGVIFPFLFGYLASYYLFHISNIVSIFIGATLTATSVGITARTLTDLGQLRTPEAKIILGAAVVDDVIGLIILAVVTGLVNTGSIAVFDVVKTSLLAIVFLVGAIVVGIPVAPHMLNLAKKLRTRGILTISAMLFCLILAYAAHGLHLATIVGAFAAGLVLARTEDLAHIQERIKPVADIFVPIFFVMLGVSVNLSVFNPYLPGNRGVLLFMGVLVFVAVIMKLFAGLGVIRKGVNRVIVGVGMIPRGEVGLIFASIGLARKIITPGEYAAIVAIVVITTFITPPLLKMVLKYYGKRNQDSESIPVPDLIAE
ncbi:MAG: cation:proton antiporter [Armatimonadota bacterium]